MPWCPKCGIEYREGFKTCSDCECELEENPVQAKPEQDPECDRAAFLISVGSSIEADMIEGLLKESKIPVLKKYGEGSDCLMIYTGGTNMGVDLYVPSHLLDRAKEIISSNQESLEKSEITEEELEAQALAAEPVDEDEETEEEEQEEAEKEKDDPGDAR